MKLNGKFLIKFSVIASREVNQIKLKYSDSSKSVFNYENIEFAY
jgi:hypothetical protein